MEAADGERGLERARSALPDLIVSDVMMPERDGFSMLKALRQNPQTSCVPVVMLTARAEETAQVTGLETGADAYVTKPFDADVLTAHVDRLLTARRQLRERIRKETEEASRSSSGAPSPDRPSSFEKRVRTAVRAHLSDPDFSVADLADAVALSRGHLTEKVKAELGQTPSALLRSMRLKKGAELLAREEGTVTEIAYAVGFNSLSYFSRCFKDEFGVPPSAYRTERA
jgi:YesN/AraC family two-component response regulator